MPPFDASAHEPMPEVEINPRDDYWVDPDDPDWLAKILRGEGYSPP